MLLDMSLGVPSLNTTVFSQPPLLISTRVGGGVLMGYLILRVPDGSVHSRVP